MKKVLFLAVLSIFGKEPSDSGIPYRQLTWGDFKGTVPGNVKNRAAESTTSLEYGWEQNGDVCSFGIVAHFYPYESFVVSKSDASLRHEQTHFRIAQIMALKAMCALEPLQGGSLRAIPQADQIYRKYCRLKKDMEILFDQETNHSLNVPAEQKWELKISTELLNLDTLSPKKHG